MRQFLSVLLLLFLCRIGRADVQYTVRGIVTDRAYQPWSSTVLHSETYDFEVYVLEKAWRINLHRRGTTNNALVRSVGSEDGTNTVYLDITRRGPSRVVVDPHIVPIGRNVPAFVHLWVVYASSQFFAESHEQLLHPVFQYAYCSTRPEEEFPEQMALVELGGGAAKLPRLLIFLENQTPLDAQIYTNGLYRTSDYRTIGKTELPGKMEFFYYLPPSDDVSPTNSLELYSCQATIISTEDSCLASAIPFTLPARFVAQDLRIKSTGNSSNKHGQISRVPTYNWRDFSRVPTSTQLGVFQTTEKSVWRGKILRRKQLTILTGLVIGSLLIVFILKGRSHRS